MSARQYPELSLEEEPAELYLLSKAFTTGPLPVHLHSVTSVAQALAFLRHEAPYGQAPRPQLLVASIKLPGKSGFGLIAERKRDSAMRSIPVVVVSLYNAPLVIHKSYALGANRYNLKPHELCAFFEAIPAMEADWLTVAILSPPPVSL